MTMTMKEEYLAVYQKLSTFTEKHIIDEEYTVAACDQYTITIDIPGFRAAIWMANDPSYTRIYKVAADNSDNGTYPPTDVMFTQPELCRAILKKHKLNQVLTLKQQQVKALQQEIEQLTEEI